MSKRNGESYCQIKLTGRVSSTRNFGIDYASGDWLLFVDSDDYIEPDTLSRYKQSISASDKYFFLVDNRSITSAVVLSN